MTGGSVGRIQIQPAFLSPNAGNVANLGLIQSGNRKLPIQLVLKHWQRVIAVRRHLVLLPVFHLYPGFLH